MITSAKHKLLILFLIVCFSGNVFAIQINNFHLKNGMEVVHIPSKRIPAIAHLVWYKAGAMDEPIGKSGIAHLFEHLMFKKTENLADGEFSKTIAVNGGDDNAGTSQDYTVYHQAIAKKHLSLVMSLEAERMKNLVVNKNSVKNEIDIVIEERNMRVDNNPKALLREKMKKALYRDHPYATPVIGWKDEIKALTKDDALNFYKTYYSPNNAILVVAGDVTIDQIKSLAEKHYGELEISKIEQKHLPKLSPLEKSQIIKQSNPSVKKSEFLRYYLAPSALSEGNKHTEALSVLSQILGGGETSRLYQKMVMDEHLVTKIGSYYDSISKGESIFGFYAIPKDKVKFEKISTTIEEEIRNIIKNGIPKDALTRAQNILKADFIYAQDGLKNMAFIYGRAITTGLSADYITKWPERISKVTEDDIIQAAKYIFENKHSVTGFLTGEEND